MEQNTSPQNDMLPIAMQKSIIRIRAAIQELVDQVNDIAPSHFQIDPALMSQQSYPDQIDKLEATSNVSGADASVKLIVSGVKEALEHAEQELAKSGVYLASLSAAEIELLLDDEPEPSHPNLMKAG